MMAIAYLIILCSVLLLEVPNSLQDCKIEDIQGVSTYSCNSIQEFEANGNSNLGNVNIYNGKKPNALARQPNLQVTLMDDGNGKISASTLQLLKDLSKGLTGTILPARTFANLPIDALNLKENGITSIEPGAFFNLNNLKNLSITENRLSSVPSGIFNNLPVEALSLSNNRISFIEKNAFMDMSNLKRLHLGGNRISDFQPENLINHPEKLEELIVNNNYITQVNRVTVKGLNNLRHLDLKNNKISQISAQTFDDLSKLEILIIGNNVLLELNPDAFPSEGMPKLTKLYLNDNRLSFLTPTTLERWKNLEHIRIGGNPWQCSCLDSIITWINDMNIQQKCDRDYYDGSRPICVIPDNEPDVCEYTSDMYYYKRYSDTNNQLPKSSDCVL